jgi:hypothetical protein
MMRCDEQADRGLMSGPTACALAAGREYSFVGKTFFTASGYQNRSDPAV